MPLSTTLSFPSSLAAVALVAAAVDVGLGGGAVVGIATSAREDLSLAVLNLLLLDDNTVVGLRAGITGGEVLTYSGMMGRLMAAGGAWW